MLLYLRSTAGSTINVVGGDGVVVVIVVKVGTGVGVVIIGGGVTIMVGGVGAVVGVAVRNKFIFDLSIYSPATEEYAWVLYIENVFWFVPYVVIFTIWSIFIDSTRKMHPWRCYMLGYGSRGILNINYLTPGRREEMWQGYSLSKIKFMSSFWSALSWMPQNFTNEKSTLLQVMDWCHLATSHYLSKCWPRSVSFLPEQLYRIHRCL